MEQTNEHRTVRSVFMRAPEVAELMGISLPKAYKIIQTLNRELTSQGYITVAGRVSRKYLESKLYA